MTSVSSIGRRVTFSNDFYIVVIVNFPLLAPLQCHFCMSVSALSYQVISNVYVNRFLFESKNTI